LVGLAYGLGYCLQTLKRERAKVKIMNTVETINEMNTNQTDDSNAATDVVLAQFIIPEVAKLAGVDEVTASTATLASQAKLYADEAKKLSSSVKDSIKPLVAECGVFQYYGEASGKLEDEADDDYAKKVVKAKLPNGTVVSVPVSVGLGITCVAMVKHLCKGGIPLAKWDRFDFSKVGLSIARAGEGSTNGGKDADWKPVLHTHVDAIFEVKCAMVDKGGKLVGFYEVLVKAAQAVYLHKDELAALKLVDGMSEKTGLPAESLKVVVQAIVSATYASDFRKLASSYAEKATLTSKQREQRAESQGTGKVIAPKVVSGTMAQVLAQVTAH
jgi:hypothetical protein